MRLRGRRKRERTLPRRSQDAETIRYAVCSYRFKDYASGALWNDLSVVRQFFAISFISYIVCSYRFKEYPPGALCNAFVTSFVLCAGFRY